MEKQQSKPYDTTFKELLELRPLDALVLAGVTDVIQAEFVDAELSTMIAAADKVLRVRSRTGEFLVHFEFQSGYDAELADRIFWYNAALYHRHGLPVWSVVVLLTSTANNRSLTGTLRLALPQGRECLSFHYDVIRLWQTPVESILNGPIGLLPLAPLCQGAEKIEAIVARMDRRIAKEATRKESATLWSATYFLMGMRYDPEFVMQLIPKGIDMKESTTYQATLEEGRTEGRAEGRAEEARKVLLRVGIKHLGEPSTAIQSRVDQLDVEAIESLIERVLGASTWEELLPTKTAVRKSRKKTT